VSTFLLIPILTAASYGLGALAGLPWLLPVLNTIVAYPFMARAVIAGRLSAAAGRMLVWAATLAVCATTLAYLRPSTTATLFLHASAYEREMVEWIDTGRGRESTPREFLPQHALHAAAFSGLSLATGSTLSMPFGAALMNYMGHYAGAVGARRRSPLAAALAWHPWAVIRVVSFVLLGVALSGPVLCRARGRAWRWNREARTLLIVAMVGLALDVLLKAGLAPVWRRLLIAERWQ
jgi:hypothetical protein